MNLPNKLTILRVLLVPVFVALYMKGLTVPSLIVFLAASFTDFLDGYIARTYDLTTNFGKIMDPLADKVLVVAAFCCMVENGTIPAWILIVILAREFTVSGMRTVAAAEGIVIAAGMTGKLKTVLQSIAVPLLIVNEPAWVARSAIVFLAVSVIMTVLSGVEYVYRNRHIFTL